MQFRESIAPYQSLHTHTHSIHPPSPRRTSSTFRVPSLSVFIASENEARRDSQLFRFDDGFVYNVGLNKTAKVTISSTNTHTRSFSKTCFPHTIPNQTSTAHPLRHSAYSLSTHSSTKTAHTNTIPRLPWCIFNSFCLPETRIPRRPHLQAAARCTCRRHYSRIGS